MLFYKIYMGYRRRIILGDILFCYIDDIIGGIYPNPRFRSPIIEDMTSLMACNDRSMRIFVDIQIRILRLNLNLRKT